MNSIILKVATRYLVPLLLVLSLVVLYRGHNLPGGGFIGGLIAGASVMLMALAYGWNDVVPRLRVDPLRLMVIGLALAIFSGMIGLFDGHPFLTGEWLPTYYLPLLGKLKLGTPLLFDVGVYLTVIGFTLKCAIALGTEEGAC